jgi:streptomycin 6-kinase
MFDPYLVRWNLVPDGVPTVTPYSRLLPVRRAGQPAMLKIATAAEERRGAQLMVWWRGDGAARVIARAGDALLMERAGDALLMERAMGTRSLAEMARGGRDDEASRAICGVAARLHAHDDPPPRGLVPLARWFQALDAAADSHELLALAAASARRLLARQGDVVVLHGDLHHGNVLDGGERGWLAVDPKGLLGERAFDFANIFCNPDRESATAPGRLVRQATVVADAAGLDRARLLQWVLAYAGLSAAWSTEDGGDPGAALAVAALAARELESA